MENQVFLLRDGWHVAFDNHIASATWNERGPALAQLDLLERGRAFICSDGTIRNVVGELTPETPVITARLVDRPGSRFGRYVLATGLDCVCQWPWNAEDGPLFEQLKTAAQRVRQSLGMLTAAESFDGTTFILHLTKVR